MYKWVLKDTSGHFGEEVWLEYIGGDWGPNHTVTSILDDAIIFDSRDEALEYAKGCGWSYKNLSAVKIKYITAQISLA